MMDWMGQNGLKDRMSHDVAAIDLPGALSVSCGPTSLSGVLFGDRD